MKKILVFVLTLLVAATALIGCAPRDPETPETPDEVNLDIDKNITAEVSILIPSGNANEKTMIEALIESFNEIYPNVTFKYSYVAVNSYENTVRNLFRTGSLDDIVWTNSPDVYYLADKNIATVVTFVNKDILKKAGVDLDPETTLVKDGWSWADFMSVCAQVRTYLDNNGMSDYYVCDANLTAWLSTSYPVLRSYGADMLDESGKSAIDSPETRECLAMIREMVDKRYIVDTSKESASSFESGTSTFLFQSASISLFANRPALKGKIDLVSFPLIQEKNTPKIGSGIAVSPSACRKSSGTSSGVSNVFFPVRSIPKSLKQSSQSDSMKSNDGVPEGSGSKRRVKEASPDSGIQKSESGVIPSAPVSIYRFPPACRYDSEEMRIQLWGR